MDQLVLSAIGESIRKRLSKRIKKGNLTVDVDYELEWVLIRYSDEYVEPKFKYAHWIELDNIIKKIISEMVCEMEEKGYDPSDYLEV